MKKILLLLLAFTLFSSFLVSCEIFNTEQQKSTEKEMPTQPSEGLEFRLNDDGTSYSAWGIGTCEDADVVIPDTYNGLPVTSVAHYAFKMCKSLERVKIPESVTSIERGAFDYCQSLTTIIIPKSVTTIVDSPFEACTALVKIEVDKDNQHYKSIDGNLYSKDGKTLIRYAIGKKDTEFTISDFVTKVENHAFAECKALKSINMPDSVTSVGVYVFYRCASLESIKLSNSIDEISWSMFKECTSLTDIVIPNSVKSIGASAFDGCTALTEIVIPNDVTIINGYTFAGCKSLQSINILGNVTKIGAYAFSQCTSLTKIVIPDSVERIDGFAFDYCSSLTIYCEASAQPSRWHPYWNHDNRLVVWGYTGK